MPDKHEIVFTAIQCLGTPFHLQGRIPSVGLDCVGLLSVIAQQCNCEFNDAKGYKIQSKNGELEKNLHKSFDVIEHAEIGDILAFWLANPDEIQHIGVKISDTKMIHADTNKGVQAVTLDERWQKRICKKAFRFRGK